MLGEIVAVSAVIGIFGVVAALLGVYVWHANQYEFAQWKQQGWRRYRESGNEQPSE